VDQGRVPLHQRVPTLLACSNAARQPIARAGDGHVWFADPNASVVLQTVLDTVPETSLLDQGRTPPFMWRAANHSRAHAT
jgi:hypothetical protein